LCLPGTHSKWCRVENGHLISFRTLIVGEMFELFCKHSLLRHSVGDGWDEEVFRKSVTDVLIKGQDPLALLFAIRAQGLLQDMSTAAATARLSGLLLGAELRAADVSSDQGAVALVGGTDHCARYKSALDIVGCRAQTFDGEDMVVAGLSQIAQYMGQNPTMAHAP
ncbi:MAG: 2-dehydro-3-deoxygalactonokinase, partial [Pseudomonadota bacterium]